MIDFFGNSETSFCIENTGQVAAYCAVFRTGCTALQDHFQILFYFHFQNFGHFVQSLLFGNLYSLQIKQYLFHLSAGEVCLNLVNPEIATVNPRHTQKLHLQKFVCSRLFHRNGEDGVQFVRSLPTISIFKYSQSGRDGCHHHCLLF